MLPLPDFVDITPHVSLLPKLGQAGHSVAEAVSELVDNSLDARLPGKVLHVSVEYDVRAGWIRVADDGDGMTYQELSNALVLGLSGKAEDQIGRFGLGMKSACTSLGSRFEVVTRTAQGKMECVASYDEAAFIERGAWLLPISRRKKTGDHGTEIRIDSGRIYNGLAQSLIRNLGWTFRHFIADHLIEITVNGQQVEPPQHQIDQASMLPLDGTVGGRHVRGWVALLEVSSQRGSYGFDLIRHRRVIRRHQKIGFQAHPQTARVVGELHLDEFPTNNLKTDFIRETDEWRELELWISEHIEPVVAASRALAHAGQFDSRLRDLIERERAEVLKALGEEAIEDVLEVHFPGRNRRLASDAVSFVIGPFHVEHLYCRATDEPYLTRERITRIGEPDLLRLTTNLTFPGISGDAAAWGCHNVAEALALELGSPEDHIETKAQIWKSLAHQKEIATELRRSAMAFIQERDAALL